MKKLILSSVFAVCGAVLYASDASNKQFSLALVMSKKHTVPAYGNEHASSKSFFVLSSGDDKKVFVYDRRKKYAKYDEYAGRGEMQSRRSVGIVADDYVVQAQEYDDGLWVTPIGNAQNTKNIKLPLYQPSYKPSDLIHQIEFLQSMPQQENQLLFNTWYAGMFVLDVVTEKPVRCIKKEGVTVGSMIVNKSGEGFWHTTLERNPACYTVSYCDLRTGTSTQRIEVPAQVSDFSVSPSGKYFAMTSLNFANRLFIFDIAAKKRELIQAEATDYRVDHSFFVSDDTVVYSVSKGAMGSDQSLKSLSLSSSDEQTCKLQGSGVDYHHNTGLLVSYRYPFDLEIYETGTK